MEYFIKTNLLPSYMAEEIVKLNLLIDLSSSLPDSDSFDVTLCNEKLEIPYRTYVNIPSESKVQDLPERQQQILSCFLTRHYNGFVREQHLKNILLINESWVVPFISQLIGEYVSNILSAIYNHLEDLDNIKFSKFFNDNPDFFL